MLKVSSLSNSPSQQPNFEGKNLLKKSLETFKNMKCPFSGKKLSPEQRVMERLNGAAYAAKHSNYPEVIQETVIRETAAGNMDFVKGVNDVLAQNAAKDTYKSL